MSEKVDVVRLKEEVVVLQGMLASMTMDYSKLKVEESLAQKDLKALSAYCDELEEKNGALASAKIQDHKTSMKSIEQLEKELEELEPFK
jgi:hypothetical protein